jgi:hypothetical protein
MNSLRQTVKQITPAPLWQAGRWGWQALQHASMWPLAAFHPWRRESIRRLAAYKGIHQGERCFIIGNGPSLKRMNLSNLREEYTFGMNRIYMAFPDWGFHTTYFVSVNSMVIEQCVEDIRNLPMPKFLSWRSRHLIDPTEDTMFLHTTYTGPKFARDVRGRVWESATVTYVALQLAFYMGFDKVVLIGVDHHFVTEGVPNTTVVSQGDDQNHFDTAYFGKGFRWQLPDLETSERGYHLARDVFARAGREVIDATVGGNLTVFPKVDYNLMF